MQDQLVSFKTAKLAKEKGFLEDCLYHYTPGYNEVLENSVYGKEHTSTHHLYANSYDFEIQRWGGGTKSSIAAPTQSLLQKWLREKYDIHISLMIYDDNSWSAQLVCDKADIDTKYAYESYDCMTYEEALEVGLQEALKSI